jgi:hypothetical protein
MISWTSFHYPLSPATFLLVSTPKQSLPHFTVVSFYFLGLDSAYEKQHGMFVFLSLDGFT